MLIGFGFGVDLVSHVWDYCLLVLLTGHLSLSFFLFVSVYLGARPLSEAPSVSVRLVPNREKVRRGDNLEVRCDVTGDPSALVSWRRVGGSLSRNTQVLGNLLR